MDKNAWIAVVLVALLAVLAGCTSAGTQPAAGVPVKPLEQPSSAVPAPTQAPIIEPAPAPAQEDTNLHPDWVVAKNDTVRVYYKGTFDDGTEFDSTAKNGNRPLEFVAGVGQMIPGFDAAVQGMKVNDEKTIHLTADQAYGQPDPKLIKEVPLADLKKQGIEPKVGDSLYAQGVPYPLKVVEVTATTAKVDFNHPMAGKALNFWIKVEHIAKPDATAQAATGGTK